MKRVPAHFELDENDIRQAILYYLRSQGVDHNAKFDISFSVDRVAHAPPPGAPVGGMGDYSRQEITAKAVRKEE